MLVVDLCRYPSMFSIVSFTIRVSALHRIPHLAPGLNVALTGVVLKAALLFDFVTIPLDKHFLGFTKEIPCVSWLVASMVCYVDPCEEESKMHGLKYVDLLRPFDRHQLLTNS